MSADLLRRAAAHVREVAEGHCPSPWGAFGTGVAHGDHWYVVHDGEAIVGIASQDGINEDQRQPLAEHIALWHPALALAVADWLEAVRSCMGEPCQSMCCANERSAALRIARLIHARQAIKVARLILGEPA